MTILTTSELEAKRRQLEHLNAEIALAEEQIAAEETRRAALSPQQRLAEALHEMFPSYRGAGGAMDGGDPWYYEIDPNCSPADPWKGSEHAYTPTSWRWPRRSRTGGTQTPARLTMHANASTI